MAKKIETITDSTVSKKEIVENSKTVEELQMLIDEIQKKNIALEGEKTEVMAKNKAWEINVKSNLEKNKELTEQLKNCPKEEYAGELENSRDVIQDQYETIAKLQEEKDELTKKYRSELKKNDPTFINNAKDPKFKKGDHVFYFSKYQNMPFQVYAHSGYELNGIPLYRIQFADNSITELYVPENQISINITI